MPTTNTTSFRRAMALTTAIALIVLLPAFVLPSSGVADVGDQYLPNVPNAEGKEDQPGPETQTATDLSSDRSNPAKQTKPGKRAKDDGKDEAEIQVSGAPPDQGGGPGIGAVIALSILGVGLVAAVLWLASRNRRSLADSEIPGTPRPQPETPRGEITGDDSGGSR